MLTASAPVYDATGNNFIGVVGVEATLADLDVLLREARWGEVYTEVGGFLSLPDVLCKSVILSVAYLSLFSLLSSLSLSLSLSLFWRSAGSHTTKHARAHAHTLGRSLTR